MSFITNFKTVIEADPSINAIVTGGIKYVHLPEDFDIKKNWLAWDFRIATQEECMNSDIAFTTYALSITMTTTDSITLDTLSQLVLNYLQGYQDTHFFDISLNNDSKITTLSKTANTYQDAFEFLVIYIP